MSAPTPGPLPGSYWVREGRLLAGPLPARGTPANTRLRLQALGEAGVNTWIDLTEEPSPYREDLPAGAHYRRFPIPDMGVPTHTQMAAILDTIDAELAAGRTVYVHCWGGIGRTGTVIGCWLVRHGTPAEAALSEIEARRGEPGAPETDEQWAYVLGWKAGV